MVSVVQLVEHRIVVPSVVGSSPITHPDQKAAILGRFFWLLPPGTRLVALRPVLGLKTNLS